MQLLQNASTNHRSGLRARISDGSSILPDGLSIKVLLSPDILVRTGRGGGNFPQWKTKGYTDPEATDAGAATSARREGSAVSTTNSFTLVRADPACDTTGSHFHDKSIYIPKQRRSHAGCSCPTFGYGMATVSGYCPEPYQENSTFWTSVSLNSA